MKDYTGTSLGVIKADTRGFDYGSYEDMGFTGWPAITLC